MKSNSDKDSGPSLQFQQQWPLPAYLIFASLWVKFLFTAQFRFSGISKMCVCF